VWFFVIFRSGERTLQQTKRQGDPKGGLDTEKIPKGGKQKGKEKVYLHFAFFSILCVFVLYVWFFFRKENIVCLLVQCSLPCSTPL